MSDEIMNLKIDRKDIGTMITNMILTGIERLTPEQKLEALEWFKEIIEEIQDNVE